MHAQHDDVCDCTVSVCALFRQESDPVRNCTNALKVNKPLVLDCVDVDVMKLACVLYAYACHIVFHIHCLWVWVRTTPTQYVVNTLYWPHTALSVYLVCYFLVPHTHVLCMGSGSATGTKFQVRLVHSLLKYFFKFQLWYWIKNLHYQIFKFVIDNSDISLNCLQHIQKRRNFDAKVTCHQPICLLLHAILSGVGVSENNIMEPEGSVLTLAVDLGDETMWCMCKVKYGVFCFVTWLES